MGFQTRKPKKKGLFRISGQNQLIMFVVIGILFRVLLNILIWGAVIYCVLHFVFKWW
jgi:hypothetical protein